MFTCSTGRWILQLLFTGVLVTDVKSLIKGKVGQNITLPCHYSITQHGKTTSCWGQRKCPLLGCSSKIVWTDAQMKIFGDTSRYLLLGDVNQGDLSLTIVNVTENDAGTYCCRVSIKGLFNDQKKDIEVVIKKGQSETTSLVAPVSSIPALIHVTESYFASEPRWMSNTESQLNTVTFDYTMPIKQQRKEPSWTSLFVGCGVGVVILATVALLLLKWFLHKKQKMSNATSQIAFSNSEMGGIQHALDTGIHAQDNIYDFS